MNKDLTKILYTFQKEIIEETAQRLHNSGFKHYRLIAVPDIYPQIKELFNSFLVSIEDDNVGVFINSAEEIGIIGFKQGYTLEELQSNLNYLAESVWRVVSSNLESKLIPKSLETINKMILQAKDKLASIYIDQCLKTEGNLLHLKREFEDFLKTRGIR